jgi:hypothetical protein
MGTHVCALEDLNLAVRHTDCSFGCRIVLPRLTALILAALIFTTRYADGKTQISISRTSASCEAHHRIFVEANGGTGYVSDDVEDYDSGSTYAAVDYEPGPGVGATSPTGYATGDGFSHASIAGANNFSAVITSIDFYAEDDASAASVGHIFGGGDSSTEATYEVSDDFDEDDFAWIEGGITWNGVGEEDAGDVWGYSGSFGEFNVGGTSLSFATTLGYTYVYGTLMDLDGPHEIDDVILGGTASYIFRQQVGPGDEVTSEMSYSLVGQVLAQQQVGDLGKRVPGYGNAYSTLKAYTGTSDGN